MKRPAEKSVRKKLGLKIRTIRKEQGISQQQLAFEAELSREEISYLESGNKNVTFDTLLSIARALDVPLKELFDFD